MRPQCFLSRYMRKLANKIDILVFVGLLALMVLTAIVYGTVDAWWEAVFECAVFALTALWFVEVILRGSWRLKRAYVLFPLLLIILYVFVQTVPSSSAPVNTVNGLPTGQNTLSIERYQTQLTAVKTLALSLFTALL